MSIPRVVTAVRAAFRECLRERRLESVTKLYHPKAVLKGTFATKPVQGHDGIRKYFQKFFRDVEDVKFDKEPLVFKRKELVFVCGKYDFIFQDGQKIKATYQFVLDDGKIRSHFSALNDCSD
jgi:hypothetical protein